MSLYAIASMWFYAVIFALSLSTLIALPEAIFGADTRNCRIEDGLANLSGGCRAAYSFFVILFGILMMTLASFNINEQVRLDEKKRRLSRGELTALASCFSCRRECR